MGVTNETRVVAEVFRLAMVVSRAGSACIIRQATRISCNGKMFFRFVKPVVEQRRSLVYMKDGALRARGLKKEESEYLTVNGVRYPGDQETLKDAKNFVGENYPLPDDLILQAITHKSFAHGKKPYNEKLAMLGREFLRLQMSAYAVSVKNNNPHAINSNNFDISPAPVEILSSSAALCEVCKMTGIHNSIFWKKRSQELPSKESGEITVFGRCIHALVGAILLRHGESRARSFVAERLLDGPYSVISISQKFYVPQ
jgi:large subunit ribosomal protein L15